MSALYITELKVPQNKRSKSFEKESNKSVENVKPMRRSNSVITEEHSKNFVSSKRDFLEFLIQEETKFADLDKIEEFYKSLMTTTLKNYNRNEDIIKKKRAELNHIELTIQSNLVTHYKIKEEDLISIYDKQVQDMKEQILVREHDLECYENMHQRIYKANYLLNERYNTELKFEVINDQQFKKYQIIKNNAFVKVKKQKKFLDNMKTFNGISNNKFESNIEQKKKKFNELEFQVFTIKSDTVIIEKKLYEIKGEILKVYKKMKETKNKNADISRDYKRFLKSYLEAKIKLFQIYKSLKVGSLEDIIDKFNEEKLQYQTLYSQFVKYNKIIADLNMDYTNLKINLEELNVKIQDKLELTKMRENTSDDIIAKIDSKRLETKHFNLSSNERVMHYERIIKNTLKYLKNYDGKLSEVMKTLYFAFNIDSRIKKVALAQNKEIKFTSSTESNNYSFINSDNAIDNILQNNNWDVQSIKSLLNFFSKFEYKFIHVISIVCSNVAQDLGSTNLVKMNTNELSQSSENNLILSLNKKSFDVYYIFKENILSSLDEYIEQAMFRLENKIKILSRTEREIFKDRKTKRETLSGNVSNKKKTSIDNLFSSFTGYLGKKGEIDKINFLQKTQAHLLSHVNKFTNELVLNEKEQKLQKKKEKKSNYNKTEFIAKFKSSSRGPVVIQEKSTDFNQNNNPNSLEDSYLSTKVNQDLDESQEILNFGGQKNNKEMVKIYSRLNDLRNLDMKYFKLKETNLVNNGDFNEIYYNFKKKYNLIHNDDRKIKTANNLLKTIDPKPVNKMNKTSSNFGLQKMKNSKSEMNIIKTPVKKHITKTESLNMKKEFIKSLMEDKMLKDNEKFINSKTKSDFRSSSNNGFYSTGFSNASVYVKNMKSSHILNSGKTMNYLKLPFVDSQDIKKIKN